VSDNLDLSLPVRELSHLDRGILRSMGIYFIKCVSAFDLEFGGRIGINPESEG
jgi:hypothetical protein